ncbi:hypothetical protein BUY43_01635 [Staphylococcus devriesei]|uniref:Phage protein n=1 Tax=Staphylococcus devriesei TaxID=586733 RepID=A0A2T4KJI3_9STAP|nr:hypothetical protein [Staphylococcus devriesei]PTE74114.1 hypothetical protein BUY44_02925 [Staphylococcus devriesei]RIL75297.1 hypothetical protein BUY43_01635 [Staphylococcus devriesei]
MNAEAKFVSSVMDARLKKAKRERDAYKQQRDELIKDIAQLRERNKDLEHENKALRLQATSYFDKWAESMRKTNAFDEIAVTVLSEDNDVIKNMNNIVTKIVINNLEREE